MTQEAVTPEEETIDRIVEEGIVDVTDDTELNDLLAKDNFNWDDLTAYNHEIAGQVMGFMHNVNSLISTPAIVNNLGEDKDEFDKLVTVFFTDLNDFSLRFKELAEGHADKSGPVKDVSEYDNFNRISLNYNSLNSELLTLLAPTITQIVALSFLAENREKAKNQYVTTVQPVETVQEQQTEGVTQ